MPSILKQTSGADTSTSRARLKSTYLHSPSFPAITNHKMDVNPLALLKALRTPYVEKHLLCEGARGGQDKLTRTEKLSVEIATFPF